MPIKQHPIGDDRIRELFNDLENTVLQKTEIIKEKLGNQLDEIEVQIEGLKREVKKNNDQI